MDWAPQQDLLGDARVTAFVTHGGLNSVYEVRGSSMPHASLVAAFPLHLPTHIIPHIQRMSL